MKNRSILLAVTFATLVSSVCTSSSFARNAAAGGAAGAAGSSSGGGSGGGAGGGGGGTGGGGTHVFDLAILNPVVPPVRNPKPKPIYQTPVAVQTLRDARCALGPTEYGYFGPERVMLTQICANQL
jgi:hypothetical protein